MNCTTEKLFRFCWIDKSTTARLFTGVPSRFHSTRDTISSTLHNSIGSDCPSKTRRIIIHAPSCGFSTTSTSAPSVSLRRAPGSRCCIASIWFCLFRFQFASAKTAAVKKIRSNFSRAVRSGQAISHALPPSRRFAHHAGCQYVCQRTYWIHIHSDSDKSGICCSR